MALGRESVRRPPIQRAGRVSSLATPGGGTRRALDIRAVGRRQVLGRQARNAARRPETDSRRSAINLFLSARPRTRPSTWLRASERGRGTAPTEMPGPLDLRDAAADRHGGCDLGFVVICGEAIS